MYCLKMSKRLDLKISFVPDLLTLCPNCSSRWATSKEAIVWFTTKSNKKMEGRAKCYSARNFSISCLPQICSFLERSYFCKKTKCRRLLKKESWISFHCVDLFCVLWDLKGTTFKRIFVIVITVMYACTNIH